MHPDEELLFQYVERGVDHDVATHVADCPTCRREVDTLRLFLADMKSDVVWAEESATPELPPSLVSLATKLTRDRAGQEGAAAIEALNMRVLQQLERDPKEAVALSEEAIARAQQLGDDYPEVVRAQLLGCAWKNRANVHRQFGEFSEAFTALDRAEEAYRRSSVNAFDLATVDYVRGTTHYCMNHYDAALPLLEQAARVFEEFGDHRRYTHARLVEAGVYFDRGDAARARDAFYALLPEAHADGDRETLARLFSNIAQCHVNLGEHPLASTYCRQALALYRQLGMKTEAVRTNWILGRMLNAMGEYDEAKERLAEAESDFTGFGMEVEASLVALDVAESMLASGEVDAVPDVCRRVVGRFITAELPQKAQLAHTLATEALQRGATPTELLGVTRQLVETLPTSISNRIN